jgi:hypothetical protein
MSISSPSITDHLFCLNGKCSLGIVYRTSYELDIMIMYIQNPLLKRTELTGTLELIIIPIDQAGTKRDKATVDDTTNKINKLLFKVNAVYVGIYYVRKK